MLTFDKKIITFRELHSTNTEAKRLGKDGAAEGTTVFAQNQTAGRGKPGTVWFSKYPGSLTFSIILRPRKNLPELADITLVGARALQTILRDKYNLRAEIKLPNDVLLNGKKVCGILAERAQDKRGEPFVVLGMGVNVNLSEEDFPEDLQKSATSVALCSGGRIDFGAFFSLLLTALEECYLKMLR